MADFSRDTRKTPIDGVGYGIDEDNVNIARAFVADRFGHLRVSDASLENSLSPLNELVVAERTVTVELNSSYGLSALRDVSTNVSGATVTTAATSEFLMASGTQGAGAATLQSAKIGRYLPGYSSEIGIGIRLGVGTVFQGNQSARWGGLGASGNNGFFFGQDSGGLFIERLDQGVVLAKVYQSDWNVDPLDGTGKSGYDFNPDIGHIFRIQYTWYGYGEVAFGLVGRNRNNKQAFITCHVLAGFEDTSTAAPNMKVHAEVRNAGTANNNINLYVGGRQYSIIGKYVPKYRYTSDFRSGVSAPNSLMTPLVSFRRKAGFENRSLKLKSFESVVSTNSALIEVYINTTLTGAVFGVPTRGTASETALEADISATAMSGGILIGRTIVPAGTGTRGLQLDEADLDFDLPDVQNITLAARGLSGTATIDAALLNMKEEW